MWVPSPKCMFKIKSWLFPASWTVQFRIQADELENQNRMLFGDTDAQGLAWDASISCGDAALVATVLRGEQWQRSFILELKETVEEKQVLLGCLCISEEDVDWTKETEGWEQPFLSG